MQPKSKFKVMAKLSSRNIKNNTELRVDVRSLSWDEYKMLVELVRAASESFSKGYNTIAVGSFDLSYIDTRVCASLESLNTLAKLDKIFHKL